MVTSFIYKEKQRKVGILKSNLEYIEGVDFGALEAALESKAPVLPQYSELLSQCSKLKDFISGLETTFQEIDIGNNVKKNILMRQGIIIPESLNDFFKEHAAKFYRRYKVADFNTYPLTNKPELDTVDETKMSPDFVNHLVADKEPTGLTAEPKTMKIDLVYLEDSKDKDLVLSIAFNGEKPEVYLYAPSEEDDPLNLSSHLRQMESLINKIYNMGKDGHKLEITSESFIIDAKEEEK